MTAEQALQNKIDLQAEGIHKWVANNFVGTACWATGVGKTKLAIDCIERLRNLLGPIKVLLVTPTEEMRDVDWPAEFEKWGVSIDGITAVCYASLAKTKLTDYDLFIYDECHRITLPNLRKLHTERERRLNSLKVLGLTATYPKLQNETDPERFLMLTDLMPPIHTVTTDSAVDLGLISDFELIVLKFHPDMVTHNINSGGKKPEMRTERGHYAKLTKSLQFLMIKKIEHLKFAAISKRVQFIINLPSRVRLGKEILNQLREGGRRTVVFAGSIEQANELCGENVYHSQSTDEALNKFQRGEIDEIGCVKALNEGKNLREPDQALIMIVNSVDRNLVQQIGRIIRKRYDNLEFKARIIVLVAIRTADEKWFNSAIAEFETKRIKELIVRVPDIKK